MLRLKNSSTTHTTQLSLAEAPISNTLPAATISILTEFTHLRVYSIIKDSYYYPHQSVSHQITSFTSLTSPFKAAYFQSHNEAISHFLKHPQHKKSCHPASSVTRQAQNSARDVTRPLTAPNNAKPETFRLTSCSAPSSKSIGTSPTST